MPLRAAAGRMSGKEELSEEEFPLLHHDTLVESGDLEAATPMQTPQKKAISTTPPQLTTLPPLTHVSMLVPCWRRKRRARRRCTACLLVPGGRRRGAR